MFDAYRWENFVTSLLPHLNIINFTFYGYDQESEGERETLSHPPLRESTVFLIHV
jgi:hypothetical protein